MTWVYSCSSFLRFVKYWYIDILLLSYISERAHYTGIRRIFALTSKEKVKNTNSVTKITCCVHGRISKKLWNLYIWQMILSSIHIPFWPVIENQIFLWNFCHRVRRATSVRVRPTFAEEEDDVNLPQPPVSIQVASPDDEQGDNLELNHR